MRGKILAKLFELAVRLWERVTGKRFWDDEGPTAA